MQLNTTLTLDQSEACNKFLSFLLNPEEKEFYLFGAAGCGKTFLTRHFISQIFEKDYKNTCKVLGIEAEIQDVLITATTNKAAEVLQQHLSNLPSSISNYVDTVFKALDVTVKENYATGETYLSNYCKTPISNTLLIVDECSMLPKQMLKIIRTRMTSKSKILFIGDSYQLAPVNETPQWDNTKANVTAVLSTPVRNQGNQALMDFCEQLRTTVKTGVFKDIELKEGSIELLDEEATKNWLLSVDYKDNRVLTYTNKKAIDYIDWISESKHIALPNNTVIPNFLYVNNSNFIFENIGKKPIRFYPEELMKVIDVDPKIQFIKPDTPKGRDYGVEAYKATVISVNNPSKPEVTVWVATNIEDLLLLRKKAVRNKDWTEYFALEDLCMDLRLPYASTIHKAQGNTYKEVLIDLNSFRSCKDPDVAARLLYVAASRAKDKILLHGKLPKKYGEIVCQKGK